MAKSEIYSWRLPMELKSSLEGAARHRGSSMAELLESITTGWLREEFEKEEAAQAELRLRERALGAIGTIEGADPTRSQRVHELVAARVRSKHARPRTD